MCVQRFHTLEKEDTLGAMDSPLLSVDHLSVSFSNHPKAVDDVSFAIERGEVLGLVGESGGGKTTIARCILSLEKPTSGRILFNGEEAKLSRKVQPIFQDPSTSLDPRFTAFRTIKEAIECGGRKAAEDDIYPFLEAVGLGKDKSNAKPKELSGGEKQRLAIARALAAEPELLIADEALSSLDASIQAQILLLFERIKRSGVALLFISHNLRAARCISDRIAVILKGRIVEVGKADEVIENPQHPYTKMLLGALDPLNDLNKGDCGCPLYSRCPMRVARCKGETPKEKETASGHAASCHLL